MNGWIRSERDTNDLRACDDCPPEASVYDKGELRAIVYYGEAPDDAHERWHLYVSHRRLGMPAWWDALDARQELLPNIADYAVTPDHKHNRVHIWELLDPQHPQPKVRWHREELS